MKHPSFGERIFTLFNSAFLIFVALLCVLPFVNILVSSFASSETLVENSFLLIPREIDLSGYRYIFSTSTFLNSMKVSTIVTIVGTFVNIALTALTAYPLTRKQLVGRQVIQFGIVFTMLFNGGIIPTFLVVKATGLMDSLSSLILPTAVSAFNLIIMKNFFEQIPVELEESAKIDGCNDLRIFFQIILPLSLSVLATLTLFYAVGHWNSYFNAVLYINDVDKWPVQIVLRQVVSMASGGLGDSGAMDPDFIVPSKTVQMGTIVLATTPIMIVYPFLQKYFVKGVMLGSVKG